MASRKRKRMCGVEMKKMSDQTSYAAIAISKKFAVILIFFPSAT